MFIDLNVFPHLTSMYVRNGALRYAKFFSYLGLRYSNRTKVPNIQNFFVVYLGKRSFGSKRVSHLFMHISDVVVICPYKQMCRAYTCTVIAFMTYLHAGRDFTVGHFIRKSMRSNHLRIFEGTHLNGSVSARFPGRPFPTFGSFFNFFPKSFHIGVRT